MSAKRGAWLERVRSVDASAASEIEGLDDIILALRAENERLRVALEDIAKQMINAEMDEQQHRYADYEGAYETMIKIARAALSEPTRSGE